MKVFSFCIYGNEINYYNGLLENIKIIRQYYPDYKIYIYKGICDRSWVFDNNLVIVNTGREGAINMLYRYLPITFSEIGFIRDADSRITERDRWCIDKFLLSDKQYHIIRDHFYHKSPIMGGIFGWKSKIDIIIDLTPNVGYAYDMTYIEKHVYPLIKNNCLVHSNIYGYNGEHVELIECPRNDKHDFIGNVIWNNSPKFEYFVGDICDLVNFLASHDQFKLIKYNTDNICPNDISYNKRRNFYSYCYIANFYLKDIKKSQYWLSQFEFAELDKHIYHNGNYLFKFFGKKIVASFDCKRDPADDEIVIVYGNYPDWHNALPISSKIYRHVSLFFDITHDIIEYHPSWENVDIIYILNLKDRADRYSDTLLSLANVHAPLHRIFHYKAEKDGLPPYVGATKNHVDVMKHFESSEKTNALVIEDDIVFLDDKEHVWNNIEIFFKRNYKYNITFLSISKIGTRNPFDDLLSVTNQQCTTSSAYFLNKETVANVRTIADEGLELMVKTGNHHTYCIDRYWTKLPMLYFFKKKLAYQRPSFSNLTKSVNFNLD